MQLKPALSRFFWTRVSMCKIGYADPVKANGSIYSTGTFPLLCSCSLLAKVLTLPQLGNANVDCMMQNRDQAGLHTSFSNKVRHKSSLLKRKL